MSIGERIKSVRDSAELSIREFAGHLGLSYASLSRIENGLQPPPLPMLEKLINDFNVDAFWLMTGKGEINFKSPSSIDLKMMNKIILIVEKEISARKIELVPEIKVQLIIEFYKFSVLKNTKEPSLKDLQNLIKMIG